jgi:hypothetical protein
MITKDFHLTKDFRQIRGKSFVIMGRIAAPTGDSGHTRQVRGRAGAGRGEPSFFLAPTCTETGTAATPSLS